MEHGVKAKQKEEKLERALRGLSFTVRRHYLWLEQNASTHMSPSCILYRIVLQYYFQVLDIAHLCGLQVANVS